MRHSNTRLEHAPRGGRGVQAFAPGRVNVIGEHTDYNDGLCLPFAVERGVTVTAEPEPGGAIEAHASDLGETDRFDLGAEGQPGEGWRALVRGAAAELAREGIELRGCRLDDRERPSSRRRPVVVGGRLRGALPGAVRGRRRPTRPTGWRWHGSARASRTTGRAPRPGCSTSSPRSAPARAGRCASTCAARASARCRSTWTATCSPRSTPALRTSLAQSGYNERRAECRRACELLGVESLRDAPGSEGLPAPLDRRVRHVSTENARVDAAVAALESGDLAELGRLLDASHASLRDDYDVSVPAVERAVEACHAAGALGARIMGGGFGGSVLALFGPGASAPPGAVGVRPGPPARLI